MTLNQPYWAGNLLLLSGLSRPSFTFLYLAMSSDPEYMPNREPKVAMQPAAVPPAEPTTESHAVTPEGEDGKAH